MNPMLNSVTTETERCGPLSGGFSLAVKREYHRRVGEVVATPIGRLFLRCCPSTIQGPSVSDTFLALSARVITVVINPVKAQVGRLCAHVDVERLKRLSPTFANPNTASLIATIIRVVRVGATLFHGQPPRIVPMFVKPVPDDGFELKATAAICIASQAIPIHEHRIPAVTNTFPVVTPSNPLLFDASSSSQEKFHHKPSDSLSCDVFPWCSRIESVGGWILPARIINRHQFSPCKELVLGAGTVLRALFSPALHYSKRQYGWAF